MSGEKPSRELSVSEILSLAFNLYFSKFLQFFLPFLISGMITGLLTYAISSAFPIPEPPTLRPSYWELLHWSFTFLSTVLVVVVLSGLVSWILGTVTTGIAVKYTSDQIEKGSSDLGVSVNFAMSKFPSLLVAQLVAGILIGLGLLLFIVPGVIIAIMFSLIIPTIIVEQRGAFESLGRSRKLVGNRWLKTFALLLVLSTIVLIVTGVIAVLTMPLSSIDPNIDQLISPAISAFVTPIYPIAITYLYYAMTAREIPPPPPPPTF